MQEASHREGMTDILQISLTEFYKELSQRLQLTKIKKKILPASCFIKQYLYVAFITFDGYLFYMIAFSLYLMFSANDYDKAHALFWVYGMEEHITYDCGCTLA